jgi:hypothetical protein
MKTMELPGQVFELAPQLYEACITVAAENPYV